MTVSAFIKLIISVLEKFSALTSSVFDDEVLTLLRAIDSSPEITAWLDRWLPPRAALPEGAEAVDQIPARVQQIIGPGKVDKFISVVTIIIDLYREFNAPTPTPE